MRNKYGVATRSKKPWEQKYDTGKLDWDTLRKSVYERDGYQCRKCSKSIVADPNRACHHIVSLSSGGQNAKHNLMSLCGKCHDKIHRK